MLLSLCQSNNQCVYRAYTFFYYNTYFKVFVELLINLFFSRTNELARYAPNILTMDSWTDKDQLVNVI
jgi:hypothetical protein